MARSMRCVLAVCVLGALLLAFTATAEQRPDEQIRNPAVVQGATLNHRRALRLIVESTTGWWFGNTLAQSKVTLVPASSLKKKPAAKETVVVEEKQLSTAHLKDVDLPNWYKAKLAVLHGDFTALSPASTMAEAGR